jgi:hypothetical protein
LGLITAPSYDKNLFEELLEGTSEDAKNLVIARELLGKNYFVI